MRVHHRRRHRRAVLQHGNDPGTPHSDGAHWHPPKPPRVDAMGRRSPPPYPPPPRSQAEDTGSVSIATHFFGQNEHRHFSSASPLNLQQANADIEAVIAAREQIARGNNGDQPLQVRNLEHRTNVVHTDPYANKKNGVFDARAFLADVQAETMRSLNQGSQSGSKEHENGVPVEHGANSQATNGANDVIPVDPPPLDFGNNGKNGKSHIGPGAFDIPLDHPPIDLGHSGSQAEGAKAPNTARTEIPSFDHIPLDHPPLVLNRGGSQTEGAKVPNTARTEIASFDPIPLDHPPLDFNHGSSQGEGPQGIDAARTETVRYGPIPLNHPPLDFNYGSSNAEGAQGLNAARSETVGFDPIPLDHPPIDFSHGGSHGEGAQGQNAANIETTTFDPIPLDHPPIDFGNGGLHAESSLAPHVASAETSTVDPIPLDHPPLDLTTELHTGKEQAVGHATENHGSEPTSLQSHNKAVEVVQHAEHGEAQTPIAEHSIAGVPEPSSSGQANTAHAQHNVNEQEQPTATTSAPPQNPANPNQPSSGPVDQGQPGTNANTAPTANADLSMEVQFMSLFDAWFKERFGFSSNAAPPGMLGALPSAAAASSALAPKPATTTPTPPATTTTIATTTTTKAPTTARRVVILRNEAPSNTRTMQLRPVMPNRNGRTGFDLKERIISPSGNRFGHPIVFGKSSTSTQGPLQSQHQSSSVRGANFHRGTPRSPFAHGGSSTNRMLAQETSTANRRLLPPQPLPTHQPRGHVSNPHARPISLTESHPAPNQIPQQMPSAQHQPNTAGPHQPNTVGPHQPNTAGPHGLPYHQNSVDSKHQSMSHNGPQAPETANPHVTPPADHVTNHVTQPAPSPAPAPKVKADPNSLNKKELYREFMNMFRQEFAKHGAGMDAGPNGGPTPHIHVHVTAQETLPHESHVASSGQSSKPKHVVRTETVSISSSVHEIHGESGTHAASHTPEVGASSSGQASGGEHERTMSASHNAQQEQEAPNVAPPPPEPYVPSVSSAGGHAVNFEDAAGGVPVARQAIRKSPSNNNQYVFPSPNAHASHGAREPATAQAVENTQTVAHRGGDVHTEQNGGSASHSAQEVAHPPPEHGAAAAHAEIQPEVPTHVVTTPPHDFGHGPVDNHGNQGHGNIQHFANTTPSGPGRAHHAVLTRPTRPPPPPTKRPPPARAATRRRPVVTQAPTTPQPTIDPDFLADINEARSYQGLAPLKPYQVDLRGNILPQYRRRANSPTVLQQASFSYPDTNKHSHGGGGGGGGGRADEVQHRHRMAHMEVGSAMTPELHRAIHSILRNSRARKSMFGGNSNSAWGNTRNLDPDMMADIMEAGGQMPMFK